VNERRSQGGDGWKKMVRNREREREREKAKK